jgi:hypothetical protein
VPVGDNGFQRTASADVIEAAAERARGAIVSAGDAAGQVPMFNGPLPPLSFDAAVTGEARYADEIKSEGKGKRVNGKPKRAASKAK